MGVSQRLNMYITSLMNIAFNIMSIKPKYAKNINNKACKVK